MPTVTKKGSRDSSFAGETFWGRVGADRQTRVRLAKLYNGQHRFDEAKILVEEAITLRRSSMGPTIEAQHLEVFLNMLREKLADGGAE